MVTVTMITTYRLYDATGKFFLCTHTEIVTERFCELCLKCGITRLVNNASAPHPFRKLKTITITVY